MPSRHTVFTAPARGALPSAHRRRALAAQCTAQSMVVPDVVLVHITLPNGTGEMPV